MHGAYGGWYPQGYGFGFGFPWMGILMAIVFIGGISLVLVLAFRAGKRRELPDARELGSKILLGRYARGEIDAETFRSMRAELESLD